MTKGTKKGLEARETDSESLETSGGQWGRSRKMVEEDVEQAKEVWRWRRGMGWKIRLCDDQMITIPRNAYLCVGKLRGTRRRIYFDALSSMISFLLMMWVRQAQHTHVIAHGGTAEPRELCPL